MSKHNKHKHEEEPQQPIGQTAEAAVAENEEEAAQEKTNDSEAENEQDNSKQLKELQEKVEALEDTKLRLMAEFENFRRRTNKEKADLQQSAGEDKKDKVIDCTKKGYKMGDRVIRFAQVVVGA